MTRDQFNRMGFQIYGAKWPQVARTVPQMRACMGNVVTDFLVDVGKSAKSIYDTAQKGEVYKEISSSLISAQADNTKKILTYAAIAGAGLIAFKLLSK